MKTGRFLKIPESPGDVDQLRCAARRLDQTTRPDWLSGDDLDYYRYVGDFHLTDLTSDQRSLLDDEIRQAEAAGLWVDVSDGSPTTVRGRIYVTSTAEHENWSIGIYTGSSPFHLSPAPGIRQPVLTREDVSDATAALVADPFLLRATDRWWMFFELLNWHQNKGEIGLAESFDGVHWTYKQRVLAEPFHLSYPYVFEWQNRYFLIPETRQIRQVRLYCATDFPCRWEMTHVLIDDCELVDASVFHMHDRWWMFAADRTADRRDVLRLYSSIHLAHGWTEHPRSPVVAGDSRLARPAGRVLIDGGNVYRFAQDGTSSYGQAVLALQIDELSPCVYREQLVREMPVIGGADSSWNVGGMHHIDVQRSAVVKWLACVDGRTADLQLPASR